MGYELIFVPLILFGIVGGAVIDFAKGKYEETSGNFIAGCAWLIFFIFIAIFLSIALFGGLVAVLSSVYP